MPININLKQLNISDSDQIKLDKVNYNFDQLVANGGGPPGPQGPTGQDGTQGTTGIKGSQGPIGGFGNQGTQGPESVNYWKHIPKPSTGGIDVDTVVPLWTSGNVFAPVVNIGYIESDAQYGTKQPLVFGKTPYQWNIHARDYSVSNLRFLNKGFEIGEDAPINPKPARGYDFKLEKRDGKDQMSFGFANYFSDNIGIYISGQMRFRGSISSPDSFNINDNSAVFRTITSFDSPVDIRKNLIIENAGAATDKIAVCENTSGLVKFKSLPEIGGTVPLGTIISISPSIFFDNDNFINSEQLTPAPGSKLNISVGKGIGAYAGWYLCNGKEWTDGGDSYPVPLLGKFDYTIEQDPFSNLPTSQGTASAPPSNLTTHITGGSDINMTASFLGGSYNVTSTPIGISNVTLQQGSGATFKIKQLPQIMYLRRGDLYWSDLGTGQSAAVPITWRLDDTVVNSKLFSDPYPLGVVNDKSSNAAYSTSFEVITKTGYYWSTTPSPGDISGVPSWATITGITLGPGTYPNKITIAISVSDHPDLPDTITLGITTTDFIGVASIVITLDRVNSENTTCSDPNVVDISYNFVTGYTFQLVYQAAAGWVFRNPAFATGSDRVLYGNSLSQTPPTGGGTINLPSYVLDNFNKTLRMNLSLTGIPTVGYLTTIRYKINNLPLLRLAPGIVAAGTTVPGVDYLSWFINTEPNTLYDVIVRNDTGAAVFIWVGIYQGGGSTPAPIRSDLKVGTNTIFAQAPALPQLVTYFSAASFSILNGTSLTAKWSMGTTTDTGHLIKLYWAASASAPESQRLPITVFP
jgi:hypothetical protein